LAERWASGNIVESRKPADWLVTSRARINSSLSQHARTISMVEEMDAGRTRKAEGNGGGRTQAKWNCRRAKPHGTRC